MSPFISFTLLDPRGARPGESGEDGTSVEVPEKHPCEKTEPRHHTKRLETLTDVSPDVH